MQTKFKILLPLENLSQPLQVTSKTKRKKKKKKVELLSTAVHDLTHTDQSLFQSSISDSGSGVTNDEIKYEALQPKKKRGRKPGWKKVQTPADSLKSAEQNSLKQDVSLANDICQDDKSRTQNRQQPNEVDGKESVVLLPLLTSNTTVSRKESLESGSLSIPHEKSSGNKYIFVNSVRIKIKRSGGACKKSKEAETSKSMSDGNLKTVIPKIKTLSLEKSADRPSEGKEPKKQNVLNVSDEVKSMEPVSNIRSFANTQEKTEKSKSESLPPLNLTTLSKKPTCKIFHPKKRKLDVKSDSENDEEEICKEDNEPDDEDEDEDEDEDDEDYLDEEEEYINSLDESKAADLFAYQEKLYNLVSAKKPIRFQIIESTHPDEVKARLLKLLDSTYDMSGGGEYAKTCKYIEGALSLPLGKYINETVSVSEMRTFLSDSKKILDQAVYGHEECKEYILQVIAQYASKGNTKGKVFGIQGPPGNGKTSLIRNGICKALKRPFTMIALGGISDGSFMEGHDFTYEGSMWGVLSQCLMDAKCMNPVIFFDELDKVSDSVQGHEIIGILTHLVDFTQNDKIRDRYFHAIDLDFSRCIFIFSFNDESVINAVLKDRIQIFHTKGFTDEEKVIISQQYLLPEICLNFSFDHNRVIVPKEILFFVLQKYTRHQDGVREIKKLLELLLLRFNYYHLLHFEDPQNDSAAEYSLPYTLTINFVEKCLHSFAGQSTSFSNIYM